MSGETWRHGFPEHTWVECNDPAHAIRHCGYMNPLLGRECGRWPRYMSAPQPSESERLLACEDCKEYRAAHDQRVRQLEDALRGAMLVHRCWYKNGVVARPFDASDSTWNTDCPVCAAARLVLKGEPTQPSDLERWVGLHEEVRIIYVVDGYEAELSTADGDRLVCSGGSKPTITKALASLAEARRLLEP